MYTAKQKRTLFVLTAFWLLAAVFLALFDDSRAAGLSCTAPGVQGAIVTEVYRNGSTRTLVGSVVSWSYSAGAMRVAYQADGIAIAGFDP